MARAVKLRPDDVTGLEDYLWCGRMGASYSKQSYVVMEAETFHKLGEDRVQIERPMFRLGGGGFATHRVVKWEDL